MKIFDICKLNFPFFFLNMCSAEARNIENRIYGGCSKNKSLKMSGLLLKIFCGICKGQGRISCFKSSVASALWHVAAFC